jgi:hypothetical protein
MKYKTRIFPEGDGYVGQAIVNEQVVYTTNIVKDSIMVARELSTYIANADNSNLKIENKPSVASRKQVPSSVSYNEVPSSEPSKNTGPFQRPSTRQEPTLNEPTPTPRRCCGR